jgi:hypothetical protein
MQQETQREIYHSQSLRPFRKENNRNVNYYTSQDETPLLPKEDTHDDVTKQHQTIVEIDFSQPL